MTDWRKRAMDLIGEVAKNHGLVGTGWQHSDVWKDACVSWAIQLGKEMADARAEEIATSIQASIGVHNHNEWNCAIRHSMHLARETITKKRTREQVLEEALRGIRCNCEMGVKYRHRPDDDIIHVYDCNYYTALRALNWKPE